jgi:hypothetical protein
MRVEHRDGMVAARLGHRIEVVPRLLGGIVDLDRRERVIRGVPAAGNDDHAAQIRRDVVAARDGERRSARPIARAWVENLNAAQVGVRVASPTHDEHPAANQRCCVSIASRPELAPILPGLRR